VFDTPQNFGGWFNAQVVDVTIGTYATDGIALTPELLGFDNIYWVSAGSDTAHGRMINTQWIASTGMIVCYYATVQDSVGGTTKHVGTRTPAGAQVGNGVTLATCTVRLMVIGR
jgi:hypothetical protein